MKLLPRSLFGRNALLIVLLIVLGQIGSALLLRQMVLQPRLEQLADSVARNVDAIRAGLLALPPAQRAEFLARFNQRAQPEPGGARHRSPLLTPLERAFVQAVSERTARLGLQAAWRRDEDGRLALRLPLDGTAHWLVLPGAPPEREFTGAWLAVSITSALLAVLGALWFQRRLNRPLARVVDAAQTLARGAPPPRLPEDGPLEVATVSRSFNQMVDSLQHNERERTLMLAGISHDLRTPLTKLRLAVEILQRRDEAELMAGMARSIEQMDAIVGQFLDFARGETDEAGVPLHLDVLADEVLASYADHGQPVPHERTGRTPLPAVRLRPQAMRRALGNLLENAWRHGAPPVRLRSGASRGGVWIEVLDHGPGIPPDQVELLKQPFRQAGSARSGGGAGLGLAIVDRIARQHGGQLVLAPAEGGGLRARVDLPA
ncbi:ATP-binding protein [Pseudorhodoferax sp. LjRoot39]|uniref:ATP-binding protein n=1 Tax=Pseudorhodoferax sp. LjRoot39 TaxID=3342328 RepID=UPI003ECF2297